MILKFKMDYLKIIQKPPRQLSLFLKAFSSDLVIGLSIYNKINAVDIKIKAISIVL